MAERMRYDLIGHYTRVPGVSKAAQPFLATRCFEDSLHIAIMAIRGSIRKRPTRPLQGRVRYAGCSKTYAPGRTGLVSLVKSLLLR